MLRSSSEGPTLQRALATLTNSPDGGARALHEVLTDGGECTAAARKAAFDALMATASAEASTTLHMLASSATSGLDLYGAARTLATVSLLRRCGAHDGAEVIEALEEAGLASVGDVIHYCSEDLDVEEHLGALSLELAGAIDRSTLRTLIAEARSLCDVTSRLPRHGEATLAATNVDANDDLCDIDDAPAPAPAGAQSAVSSGAVFAMLEALQEPLPSSTAPTGATSAAFAMLQELQGSSGAAAGDAADGEEPGPRPGTRSVGC